MSLTLIIGCMFSGKTTELLRMVEREEAIGRGVVVINHAHDSHRSGSEKVKTHSGKNRHVEYEVGTLDDSLLQTIIHDHIQTIAINEGQFFTDLSNFVMKALDTGTNVIVCGLDSDFMRKPFEEIMNLVPHANVLIKTTAFCKVCRDGTEAIYSKRVVGGDDRIQVGASESYIPVCRKCY